jgi:hypothetical protein
MIFIDFRWILIWEQLHWKYYLLTFLYICRSQKRSMDMMLASFWVWMWPCHSSHGLDNVIMLVATVSILFWWFSLILNEFWYEISCIGKIIFIPFYTYVERQKRSTDVILASIIVWLWSCHSSHGYDDVIMRVTTMSIPFWWFSLIQDEFWYETDCIGNVTSFPFYAYVEHWKRSTDAILASILIWIWPCHNSHGHWWCQQCPCLLF